MESLDVDELRSRIRGPVLLPGDPGFDDEVAGFNLAVRHRPDVVVGPEDADDVQRVVAWAAERRIPIAVQATGHGATEAVTGGVLLSMRRLQDVSVDVEGRTARVGAGVKFATLLAATIPHGLTALNGSTTDVGVVGYALGGGFPILGRIFGFCADHVRSFDVVTPDGSARTVDAEHEPDLFELLRGGKGNLAIVTGLEVGLVAVPEFYGGGLMFPSEDAATVLDAFRDWLPTLPREAVASVSLIRVPDQQGLPDPIRGRFCVHVRFTYLGPAERADQLLAPMRAIGAPLFDNAQARSYAEIDLVHLDPPEPLPYQDGGMLLRDIDDDFQRVLLEHVGPEAETPLLMVELRPLGGALAEAPSGRDAITGRDAAYSLLVVAVLAPPIAELVPGAMAALLTDLQPWATGNTMVNFHGIPGDATDRARAWTAETYGELEAAKRRYDPHNLLRFGHAILVPSGEPTAEVQSP